jgi:hypothetical protein
VELVALAEELRELDRWPILRECFSPGKPVEWGQHCNIILAVSKRRMQGGLA